ncbi:CpaF/VirB11 family protein [Heyndrickxia ginsengihumi]|uniref:CpaF/VirB11 family protein n=1 Tax=Heyndrickxia ginsengihumi TaxID=363870 RepID=UPI0018CC4F00|nr:CpaF/VirB11 family protein [Heyndrickxia ginsengihumi]
MDDKIKIEVREKKSFNVEEFKTEEEKQRERVQKILNDSFISQYFNDDGITDISFNGTALWLQHNQNGRYLADKQPSIDEVTVLVKQIADIQGKEFNTSQPILDTEIGFLRVNAIHKAASPDGITFALRVSRPKLALTDISSISSKEVEGLLKVLIMSKSNLIISGKTGAGKTEFQKLLVGFMSEDDKITLIEDTRDSHIKALYPKNDINSWVTLLNDSRENKITMEKEIRAALRNNPDWIMVSEVRGEEAAQMFEAAQTDHSIMTTLHVKEAKRIPDRLRELLMRSRSWASLPGVMVGKAITDLIKFGAYMKIEKLEDGSYYRYIKEIVEFTDYTEKGVSCRYLYRKVREVDETGKYYWKETYDTLSDESIQTMKDQKVYHLLPDVFKKKILSE